ncbi:unnamed protein product, partial [Ectocarpus sp. 12 AP-2014]
HTRGSTAYSNSARNSSAQYTGHSRTNISAAAGGDSLPETPAPNTPVTAEPTPQPQPVVVDAPETDSPTTPVVPPPTPTVQETPAPNTP